MERLFSTMRLWMTLALCVAGVSLAFAGTQMVAPVYGLAAERNVDDEPDESALTLGFSGEISFYGSDYRERGGVDAEDNLDAGGEITLEGSLEWETGSLMHEVDVTASAEMTTEQDSSKWNFTPTLEYTLMSTSFMIDANVDFNFSSDKDFLLGYMLWGQKKLWKNPEQSLNVTGWAYYRDDKRLLADLNVNWRKMPKTGLGLKFALGGKVDSDTLVSRVGPNVKATFSYKFNPSISLECSENVFYGLVTESVYDGGEEMDQLKISGDVRLNWKLDRWTIYAVIRNVFRHYKSVPEGYSGIFAENEIYHSAKVGVKVQF